MTDRKSGGGDYEVGYCKPPRHSRFVPGQSGNKGRRKKRPETHTEIVARIQDELVTVNGRPMTKFELAVHSVFNQTIKSGKARDLKQLFDLLAQHGTITRPDFVANAAAEAEKVMEKIMRTFDRVHGHDPEDVEAISLLEAEELKILLGCEHCREALRARWKEPGYRDLAKRYRATKLHEMLIESKAAKVRGT